MTENRGHSGGRARARSAAVRYQTVCSPVQNDPNGTCTRAQAVTFLARAQNAKATGKTAFSDVPADSYFADAVAWAQANGVTTGTSETTFSPDSDCTRAQIVTFLYRSKN